MDLDHIELRLNIKESKYLSLDSQRALKDIKWSPRWGIKKSLNNTLEWYKSYLNGDNIYNLSLSNIEEYFNS